MEGRTGNQLIIPVGHRVSDPQFCKWNRKLGCHIRTDGIQRNHEDCEFDNGVCRTSDLQIQARTQVQRTEAAYNLEMESNNSPIRFNLAKLYQIFTKMNSYTPNNNLI